MAKAILNPMPVGFTVTRTQLSALISTLKELIESAKNSMLHHPNSGICRNWTELYLWAMGYGNLDGDAEPITTYDLVSELSATWPSSSSPGMYCSFPINDNSAYFYWQGPNLASRLDLMQHILATLEGWQLEMDTLATDSLENLPPCA